MKHKKALQWHNGDGGWVNVCVRCGKRFPITDKEFVPPIADEDNPKLDSPLWKNQPREYHRFNDCELGSVRTWNQDSYKEITFENNEVKAVFQGQSVIVTLKNYVNSFDVKLLSYGFNILDKGMLLTTLFRDAVWVIPDTIDI